MGLVGGPLLVGGLGPWPPWAPLNPALNIDTRTWPRIESEERASTQRVKYPEKPAWVRERSSGSSTKTRNWNVWKKASWFSVIAIVVPKNSLWQITIRGWNDASCCCWASFPTTSLISFLFTGEENHCFSVQCGAADQCSKRSFFVDSTALRRDVAATR